MSTRGHFSQEQVWSKVVKPNFIFQHFVGLGYHNPLKKHSSGEKDASIHYRFIYTFGRRRTSSSSEPPLEQSPKIQQDIFLTVLLSFLPRLHNHFGRFTDIIT